MTAEVELPAVILWDPYLMHSKIISPPVLKCHQCGNLMNNSYWNDGSTSTKQPRMIHGVNDVVYLVSAVYTCDNRHKILAHDESILKLLPQTLIPFMLSHKTGFTKDLYDMCTSFCRKGINFYSMESLLLEKRWEQYVRKQDLLSIPVDQDDTDFLKSSMANSPSNNMLAKCFLTGFLWHENIYLQEMASIPIGESISFDHTFKIASNIGYIREDKRWITEYDSVFLVLNEKGQVLTWQLTKGTSFAEVTGLLKSLAVRSNQQLKAVYVDDCCKLTKKINDLLGSHVSVKLDLFHAVQRISKTIPKKHVHASQFLKELRMVFRSEGDCGDKRLFPTPSSQKLIENLDKFIAKWQQNDKTTTLFKPETASALERLRKHMQFGCLSDIPVGAGTNRNERLHQHLKSYFNRSKIGILLAYALLSVILHAHNTSIRLSGKLISRPISASPFRRTLQSDSIESMGIIPKQLRNKLDNDHWETDTSEVIIDYGLVIPLYQRSLHKLYIVNGLIELKITELAKNISNFNEFCLSDTCYSTTKNQLQSLIEYGLTISPANADGNCFFQSVAINICANPSAWSHLHVVGKIAPNVPALTAKLRQLFVDEILGEHRKMYEYFIQPIDDYVTESKRFLQDGFYNNDVGDLMPVAMATALLTNIIIFRQNEDHHVHPMYVVPMNGSPNGTVFLVYNPAGTGHYDAAIPCSYSLKSTNTADLDMLTKKNSCSCGVNPIKSKTSCSPNPTYATRCKCYNKGLPCSSMCKCKECANPHGLKPAQPPTKKRSRVHHSMQLEIPASKKFALDRGEVISEAVWSRFESIVLDELCTSPEIEQSDIPKLYNDVVHYSKCDFCTMPLQDSDLFRSKTVQQIQSKLKYNAEHAKI